MKEQTVQIHGLATAHAERLVAVRRDLHRHPELSKEEFQTTKRLQGWLAEANISILPLALQTGIVAEVIGALPGPIVAIRADIDALPIHEETGLSYASTVAGRMHACGHDFHTSAALGAAFILKEMQSKLAGTVRFLFQPAEEIATGARIFIKAGALEGVQAIFGLHNKPDLAEGVVGIKSGPLMAAADTIQITVRGKGGHAAIPDQIIDPVVAGSAIVMALQTAISRSISPLDAAVVSIGSFQAGGVHNVIPATGVLKGTVRTFTPEVRSRLPLILNRIVRQVAAGYGATAELEITPGPPAVDNPPAMAAIVRRAAAALKLPVAEAIPTMAGEDFAEYQQLTPGCFVWLGTGCTENWHHPRFMVAESLIPTGAALLARTALEALHTLTTPD